MNRLSQKRLVDKLVDAHLNWRHAGLPVSDAYRSLASHVGTGATAASVWHMTAPDPEERAAKVYTGLVRRAGQLIHSKNEASEPGGPT